MNYRQTPRTALVFTGSIADIKKFEDEIILFIQNNRNNKNALLIMINSSGGINEHVFALCALLRMVKSKGHPLYIHILGQLCHFTYMIGALADWLVMEPNSSLVFGQPYVKASGSIAKVKNEIQRRKDEFNDLVAAVVKRSNGKLDEATVRSWRAKHIPAQMALEMGLCDEVLPMPAANVKPDDRNELVLRITGSFQNEANVFDHLITINKWLEDSKNDGAGITAILTSHGGTVTHALCIYGMLLEAQRRGHHVTLVVAGQAYSCSLWFATVALGTGAVELDYGAKLMFHPPWMENMEGSLDEMDDLLSVEIGVYEQTRKLLQQAKGFTPELLSGWEEGQDHYFNAEMAVKLGLGTLVGA